MAHTSIPSESIPCQAGPTPAPTVAPWHVELGHYVKDASDQLVAWTADPKLAEAIASGGGYALDGPPLGHPTAERWTREEIAALLEADPYDPTTWPARLQEDYARSRDLKPPVAIFGSDDMQALYIDMAVTVAMERTPAPLAYQETLLQALLALTPRKSLAGRLLDALEDWVARNWHTAVESGVLAERALQQRLPMTNLWDAARTLAAQLPRPTADREN